MDNLRNSLEEIIVDSQKTQIAEISDFLNNSKFDNDQYYKDLLFKLKLVPDSNKQQTLRLFKDFIIGEDLKSVLGKISKSFYILHKPNPERKVILTNKKIDKRDLKCEFHFDKNKLFFVYYSFANMDREDLQEARYSFIKSFTRKESSQEKYLFFDKSDNQMFISSKNDLQIYYFNKDYLKKHFS